MLQFKTGPSSNFEVMMNAVFIKEEIFDSDIKEEIFDSEESNSLVEEEDPLNANLIGTEQNPQNIEQPKPYICKICGKGYNHKANLWQHSQGHSTVKHKCEHCGKEYATALHLKNHRRYNHSDPETWQHQCELCSKRFPLKSKLDAHLLQHTNTKPFSCEDCAKRFYTKTELKLHRLRHSDVREFTCDICSKSFKRNQALVSHKKRFHVKHSEFYCVKCKLEFDSATEFKEHINKDKKDNVCQICLREFKFKGSLTLHMQKHESKKNYKCDQCFRNFISGKHLFSHKKRKHESTFWKHFCETCNKKFLNAQHLNKHKKNYKPYVCRVCKVKFEHDCNIESHYATHGSKAEYYCTQCDKNFNSQRGLHVHLSVSHLNKIKEESESEIEEEWHDLKF